MPRKLQLIQSIDKSDNKKIACSDHEQCDKCKEERDIPHSSIENSISVLLPFLPTFCCVQRGKGPANEKDKVHDNAGRQRERKRDEILNRRGVVRLLTQKLW